VSAQKLPQFRELGTPFSANSLVTGAGLALTGVKPQRRATAAMHVPTRVSRYAAICRAASLSEAGRLASPAFPKGECMFT